jgi:ATP-dependent Clp protease ATP-binding subunit ClpB
MPTAVRFQPLRTLDPHRQSSASCYFEVALRQRIVGQDAAVQALVELYQVFCAGLNASGRPIGNLLLLGPTGVGKTRIVEAAAETLFGDSQAMIKVDCAEFQHSHEIAKLIGSPPGYLGHRETHPLITRLPKVIEANSSSASCYSTRSKKQATHCGNSCWGFSTKRP